MRIIRKKEFMTLRNTLNRAFLSASAAPLALAIPAAAHAEANTDAGTAIDLDREYLPADIVVTANRDEGYGNEDGQTATKTPTSIVDVPQTITAITRDQIEDQAVRSLGDALRFVPGVSMETGEGHRDEVFIRGQETTADFYLDGLRDDAQYYRPLYNIERVEVLKGANALIFGRGAGGGAINRVSKVARLGQSLTAGQANVDSFGAFALAADVAAPIGEGAAARLNATYEEFRNHRDNYDGRFIGISPTVTLALSPDTRFVASYTYDDDDRTTDRGIPSLAGGPIAGFDTTFFGDPAFNRSEVQAHILRARIDHDFSSALSGNASVQFADYDKFYANIVPSGATANTVRLSGYDSGTDRTNLIGQGNMVWQGDTGPLSHTLLVGAEFARQDTDAVRNQARFSNGATSVEVALDPDTIFIPAFGLEPQRASTSELETLSLYVQDQVAFSEWLQVVAGVRFDSFELESVDLVTGFAGERGDEMVSPRVGVIVKPLPALSLYASYAESFLPASGDQFTVLSQGSVQLDPEKFSNREIGFKYLLSDRLLLTGAAFRLDRSNTPSTDGLGLTVLTGKSRVEGVEFSLAGEVTPDLHVNVGYTLLDGEILTDSSFASAGTALQQLPRHQIGAWARYDLTERLGVGAGLVHQSDQFASFSNNVVLPAYTRVDTAVFYELSEGVNVQLNVENLLDEDYYPSAHGDNNIQPGKPLTVQAGLRFEL